MPAPTGALEECPLCKRREPGNMGYLKKCLLSSDPQVFITVCTESECCYYNSDSNIDLVDLPAQCDSSDFSGLDSALFILTNSVYLRLSYRNNNIPADDVLSRILYLALERKNYIYEIRNYLVQNDKLSINGNDIAASLSFLMKLSNFIGKAFRTKWAITTDCLKGCKDSGEDTCLLSVKDVGFMKLSETPAVVIPGKSCRSCKLSKINRYISLQEASNFVIVQTRSGISLPFEIGQTSFRLDENTYRLHAVTTVHRMGYDTFLCDSLGHLREFFESETKVSKSCTLKLGSLKSANIRYIVFERLFEESRSFGGSDVNANFSNVVKPFQDLTATIRKQSGSRIHTSPMKYGPAAKKPRLYSGKTNDLPEKPFSSYTAQKKTNSDSASKDKTQGDALVWRKQFQKRFSNLTSNSRKSKVSNYIATLQSLNMQILESESRLVQKNTATTVGSFTSFSVNKSALSSRVTSPVQVPKNLSNKVNPSNSEYVI